MHTGSCSKYLTSAYSARLNYLAGKKKGRYRNKVLYQLSFLLLFIYSCTSVSYLCEFIQSDVPSNTLLLPIPNEFRTLFKLGVQRLDTWEELEIQYSQALVKPERETILHNRLLYNTTSTCVHSNSHHISCLLFLYHCNLLHRSINSTTILVHRTTVHMWKWFHGLVFLILMKTNQPNCPHHHRAQKNSDIITTVLHMWQNHNTKTKNKLSPF